MTSATGLSAQDLWQRADYYDLFGNQLGEDTFLRYQIDNVGNSEGEDYSGIFQRRWRPSATLMATTAQRVKMMMTIGGLQKVQLSPYIFRHPDFNGISASIFHDYAGVSFYYSRYSEVEDYEDLTDVKTSWLVEADDFEELYAASFEINPFEWSLMHSGKKYTELLNIASMTADLTVMRNVNTAFPNSYRGTEITNEINTWYIRISSLKSDDLDIDARLISALPGSAGINITTAGGQQVYATPYSYRKVSGSEDIILTVTDASLPSGTPLTVELKVANSYVVQVSDSLFGFEEVDNDKPLPNDVAAVSSGLVKDGSNLNTLTITPGNRTGRTFFGFRSLGALFGINYNLQLNWSWLFSHRPGADNEFTRIRSRALVLELDRKIKKLGLQTSLYQIDSLYNPSFAGYSSVADDDDNDGLIASEEFIASEIPAKADRNKNGILDWKEDFIISFSSPIFFEEIDDFNHNNTPDNIEDDDAPDSSYGFDIRGIRAFAVLPFRMFEFGAGLVREQRLSLRTDATDIFASFALPRVLSPLGKFTFRQYFHSIRDNIADNINDSFTLDGQLISGTDQLLYEKSIRMKTYLLHNFSGIDNLVIDNNLYLDVNRAIAITNTYYRFAAFTRVSYTFNLGNILRIRPYFMMLKEKDMNEKEEDNFINDTTATYAVLMLRFFPKEKSFIEAGYSFLNHDDRINNANTYIRHNFNAELVINFKVRGALANGMLGVQKIFQAPRYDEGTRINLLRFYAQLVTKW